MSDVVFILGAGASKQCGAPLMAEFLDVASDLLRSKAVEDKRREFERVFAAIGSLQVVHSKAQLDLNNIESIFTVLELGRVIQRIPGIDHEEIGKAIAALKDLIVKTLEVTMLFPVKAPHANIGIPKPYEEFAELLEHLSKHAWPSRSASVITFNYDIAVDMAMFRSGFGPDYVLEKAPIDTEQMQLMKLHGSLNWATETRTSQIRPLHMKNYLSKYGHNLVPCPV